MTRSDGSLIQRPPLSHAIRLRSRCREAHLPAQQARPQASTRVPCANGHPGWPPRRSRATRQGSQTPLGLRAATARYLAARASRRAISAIDTIDARPATLKTRGRFSACSLRAAAGRPAFTLGGPADGRYPGRMAQTWVRIAYRQPQVGNAVVRLGTAQGRSRPRYCRGSAVWGPTTFSSPGPCPASGLTRRWWPISKRRCDRSSGPAIGRVTGIMAGKGGVRRKRDDLGQGDRRQLR